VINEIIWKQCGTCSRRNCRKVPPKNKKCFKFVKIQEGFKFFELAMDNNPIEVMELLHKAKLKPSIRKGKLRLERI
jgi:hypothetical protein